MAPGLEKAGEKTISKNVTESGHYEDRCLIKTKNWKNGYEA